MLLLLQQRLHVEGGGGGRAAQDRAVARDGGEGKGWGGAACKDVVVAHDRASDLSMWVGTHESGPGARGRGRRWGEGRAWVMGGRCVLMGLHRHIRGVVGTGASGKERAWAATDGHSACVGKTD